MITEEDEINLPLKVFLSKMLTPFNKILNYKSENPESDLKYIYYSMHDINQVNILNFLGYWDNYGFDRYVHFASSIRIELMKEKDGGQFFVRILYDDEQIPLKFCLNPFRCKLSEYLDLIESNLIMQDG